MTSINTNTLATIASNSLSRNERAMGTAMERLSTGLRINSAKDDAAGLAIAKKMDAQVRGLNMAVKNANDGISMLQTFEGASKEITSMLTRMRELKVQSLNETYTTDDIANLGQEYTALRTEIQRVISDTQWNTSAHMAAGGTVDLQIGANSNQVMSVAIMEWDASTTTALTVATTTAGAAGAAEVQTVTLQALAVGETFELSYHNGTSEEVYTYTNNTSASITAANLATAIVAEQTAATAVGGSLITGFTVSSAAAGVLTLTASTNGDRNAVTANNIAGSNTVPLAWASSTITNLDSAIAAATTEQAKYGAYISRLEYAADNLANVATNTDASRGRIEDADYAAETTELARTQIIAQAGTAMLAQANQAKQSVLALLK